MFCPSKIRGGGGGWGVWGVWGGVGGWGGRGGGVCGGGGGGGGLWGAGGGGGGGVFFVSGFFWVFAVGRGWGCLTSFPRVSTSPWTRHNLSQLKNAQPKPLSHGKVNGSARINSPSRDKSAGGCSDRRGKIGFRYRTSSTSAGKGATTYGGGTSDSC